MQLQDLGRYGVATSGLSQGGPMDLHAFCWANELINNSQATTCIEIALGLCKIQFLSPTTIALCGAQASIALNGKSIKSWQSHSVTTGDILYIGGFSQGNFLYLAVSGGFQVATSLGSSATVVRNDLGGLSGDGKCLQTHVFIPYPPQKKAKHEEVRVLSARLIPNYTTPPSIGIIPSYQYEYFSHEAREQFFSHPFHVTPQSNRMGYCLSGNRIHCTIDGVISEGICLGAVQITNSGDPIVLLNDRQTIGGYPKIGVVAKTDIPRLVQTAIGLPVHFHLSNLAIEVERWRKFARYFRL